MNCAVGWLVNIVDGGGGDVFVLVRIRTFAAMGDTIVFVYISLGVPSTTKLVSREHTKLALDQAMQIYPSPAYFFLHFSLILLCFVQFFFASYISKKPSEATALSQFFLIIFLCAAISTNKEHYMYMAGVASLLPRIYRRACDRAHFRSFSSFYF